MVNIPNISEKIKKLRTDRKMTRKQFAKLVGTTSTSIYRFEVGLRSPSILTLAKIADKLGIPLKTFFE